MAVVRLTVVVLVCLLSTSAASPSSDAMVERVRAHASYRAAVDTLERGYPQFVADTLALTEIPAPPFEEDRRSRAFEVLLRQAGLSQVERDDVGNVIGLRPGAGGPLLVIAAHLDTVFPAETHVKVRSDGTRHYAPGIGDNSQGLALVLSIVRALQSAKVRTTSDILFVGNVGEEGAGSLRGVRHLFTSGRYRGRIAMFVSIDGVGTGSDVVNSAVGSERHRVTFTGPGGHSYGAFGGVNPAYALAGAMQLVAALPAASSPKTTFNVGRLGGGTSVNAIPSDAWMEVDLRSESPSALTDLSTRFRRAMEKAAQDENQARSTDQGPVRVEIELMGVRPAGTTSPRSPLVETAVAATRAIGQTPRLLASSTDANLPISLGIPAITIDTGMAGGRAHAPDEWIDVDQAQSFAGQQRALLLVLSLAGLP